MAGLVADSTVLIDVLRGSERGVHWLAALAERPTCSEVSRTEVIRGLRSAERRDAEDLFSVLEWMPVVEPISRLAGELGRQYRRSHTGIGSTDLIIAATAQVLHTEPATHNVKHFPMFPGLRRPY